MRSLFASAITVGVVLLGLPFATAIYDNDHWTFSERLTTENFDKTVQAEIDAGKTMFVRWIASPN